MDYNKAKKEATKVLWMKILLYPYFILLIVCLILSLIVDDYLLLKGSVYSFFVLLPSMYYWRKKDKLDKYLDEYIDFYKNKYNMKFNGGRVKIYKILSKELKRSTSQEDFKDKAEKVCIEKNMKKVRYLV